MIILKTQVENNREENTLMSAQQVEYDTTFPGLKWKLWGKHTESGADASFCLFESTKTADSYVAGMKKRAAALEGTPQFTAEPYGVLETMSRLTRASIDMPANSFPSLGSPVEGREEMILLQVFFKIPRVAAHLSIPAMDKLYPKKAAYHLLSLPGLIWKIWGTKESSNEVSGFYLFDSREHVDMRIAHVMEAFPQKPWISSLRCDTFRVYQDISRRTGAPIDLPSTEMIEAKKAGG